MTRRFSIFCCLIVLTLTGSTCLAAPSFVTAAIHWPGGKAQFFLSDGTYVRYDIAADRADPGYPKPITDTTWPGLGAYSKLIVAACNALDPNKAYFFFSNGTYARYDIAADRVDAGYPKPTDNTTWPGLGTYYNKIVGALNWGDKVQFFLLDGSYLRYDLKADRMDAGYPKPIDNATWPGLAAYATRISCTINWDNGKAYFFLYDGTYIRYDIASDQRDAGYPKPINNQTWPGLAPYFRLR